MRSRTALILFTVFAPVTIPVYAVFLALSNLLGAAFYIVIEASLSPMLRRPVALTRGQMAILALPVALIAVPVAAVHLVIWLLRLTLAWVVWVGRWQAGLASRWAALLVGAVWLAAAAWSTIACLNAALGSRLIGIPIEGRDLYVTCMTRPRPLGELPPEVQERRRDLLAELALRKEAMHPQWETVQALLRDDETLFRWLRLDSLRRRLVDLPWYFDPAELSEDGADHCELLLGPLIFVWMLLIRWTRTFPPMRGAWLRLPGFAARVGLGVGAVYYLLTWQPTTLYQGFWFEPEEMSLLFAALSPANWLGFDYLRWVRPEWYLFNAGLWLILLIAAGFLWATAARIAPLVGWPRYYVAFLASRLLQRKRIAFFSVGAVTLCVAMMIIVISVMGGFVDSIRARAHGLLGDLVMDSDIQGFPFYGEFIERLAKLKDEKDQPLVVQATPLVRSYGILQFPTTKKTTAVHIWGVRLDEYVRVNKFGDDLFYNNRYGGTHLRPQSQPAWAFDKDGMAVLPEEMERNYEQYVAALPETKRAEELKQYHKSRGDLYPGPGIFQGPEEKPGYVGREYPGVIIGRTILFRRTASGEYRRTDAYPRGLHCFLTVLPLTRGGDISPEPPPKPSFRYVDDSRTGIHEIDSMNVYVDFDELQRLLSMQAMERADGSGMTRPRCSQVQIKLAGNIGDDRAKLAQAKERVWEVWDRLLDEVSADEFEHGMLRKVGMSTWEEMQASYIAAIEKEKFLVLIMFGVISIVAIFLILCIFYMIVQEKTRDIGIIKSVGGSAEGVAAVFLVYGGAIGLVGCILGGLLGTTFVEHINEIQDWLARLNPEWRVWSPETYSFDKIPDVWKWSEVIWISVLSVFAAVTGATFPAIRAGRTWPVETLRYE